MFVAVLGHDLFYLYRLLSIVGQFPSVLYFSSHQVVIFNRRACDNDYLSAIVVKGRGFAQFDILSSLISVFPSFFRKFF